MSQDQTFRFDGKRIVLGVSGSVSAYKAADLASGLVQLGAEVNVVLTAGGAQFVQPMTFQAITHRDVYSGVFDGWHGEQSGHVTLAREADAVLIAPASANTIARLAHGFADDMLTAVALATEAPILLAPAMEHHMWHHPATVENLELLCSRGVEIVPPESGRLASGASGDGRLPTREVLLAALERVLGLSDVLAGVRLVVTAGGTREPLDPVRYLGNRSTGQMGVAIAEAARRAGATVHLIATASVEQLPTGVRISRVETAEEVADAVRDAVEETDVLVMAAAVADFRPATRSESKIKKQPDQDTMSIELVKNPDILASTNRSGLLKIGFAAETNDLLANAGKKLRDKGLAMIVANDAERTIGSASSQATLLFPDREPVNLPETSKSEVAERIVTEIAGLLGRSS